MILNKAFGFFPYFCSFWYTLVHENKINAHENILSLVGKTPLIKLNE